MRTRYFTALREPRSLFAQVMFRSSLDGCRSTYSVKRNSNDKKRGPYSKSSETRRRVLDAAWEEAHENGLQSLRVAKVADRAGLAIGVVNYHFGSREAMFGELTNRLFELIKTSEVSIDEEGDFFETEEKHIVAWIEFLRSNPRYVSLMEEARAYEPELYRVGVEGGIKFHSKRIKRGIERGDLEPMNETQIRRYALFMLGAHRFMDQLVHDKDCKPADLAADFINMLRNGLQRRKRKAR